MAKFSWDTKKKSLYLLLTSVLFLCAMTKPVLADNKIIITDGKERPLCREIADILNLPENKGYLQANDWETNRRWKQKLFFIPSSSKNFEIPIWTSITPAEFNASIPENDINMHVKKIPEDGAEKIKKTFIDVFNTGQKIFLYSVLKNEVAFDYVLNSSEFTFDFNNNIGPNLPFLYMNEVYFLDRVPNPRGKFERLFVGKYDGPLWLKQRSGHVYKESCALTLKGD